jgi:hypothetical protein
VTKLDTHSIERLSMLDHGELAAAAPFDAAAVDAKLRSFEATESKVDAALTDPETSHHLRDTNFLDRGEKENAGGKGIKVAVPGKSGALPIEADNYVRLEPIPPAATGGLPPATITRVEVEGRRADVATKPIVKGELVKGPTDWELPVPGSPYPKVIVEVTPGGVVPFVEVETPPPGTRIQLRPKDIAQQGFAGGHTRDAWTTTERTYGDFVTKTGETGIKFKLPGSGTVIEAAAIEASVTVKGVSKSLPDPKSVFETNTQLDAFEAHARPYIAAKMEALQGAAAPRAIVTIEVPVVTMGGADTVAKVELPWKPGTGGQLERLDSWWLAKGNFAKGSAFNP